MSRIRTYSELRRLETFEDRFDYLELRGVVGESTFGFDRWLNQQFYRSREWKNVRNSVIVRDLGCDLGVPGYEIHSGLLVHHMNPISAEDIKHGDEDLLNAEYLVLTSQPTHNAIHYGNRDFLPQGPTERTSGDTKLW
jgi:hypothetical protein